LATNRVYQKIPRRNNLPLPHIQFFQGVIADKKVKSALVSEPSSHRAIESQAIMPSEKSQPQCVDSAAHMPQSLDEPYSSHRLAEALVHWFTEHGGQLSDDVQVAFSDSRGFHVRAVRSLTTPVVVTCPLNLTLSCLNLDLNQKEVLYIDSPLQQCKGKIPDHILTYLLLIEQRKKGEASPWHAYISCLPGLESMTTPLWFDEEDLAFVVGTSLAPAAKERQKEYQQQWEHALSVMKDAEIALADEVDL
jgi:hypothetical protein